MPSCHINNYCNCRTDYIILNLPSCRTYLISDAKYEQNKHKIFTVYLYKILYIQEHAKTSTSTAENREQKTEALYANYIL